MTEPTSLGGRVAFYRKRRGLSQVELGRLIGRSESWISQVERDVRKIDRMSVLVQLADVLGVPVTALAPAAPIPTAPPIVPEIEVLRQTLIGNPVLQSALLPPESRAPAAVTVESLAGRCESAWRLVHASRLHEAGPMLADLIGDLEVAIRAAGSDVPALARLTSSAYQAAAALLAKAGEHDAAWVASDRAWIAAERTADPDLLAASQYRLAQSFLSAGLVPDASRAAGRAAAVLDQLLTEAAPETISIFGALHLVMAVSAARMGDRRKAWGHVARAEDAAARLGSNRNDFGTEFGPTNVALHAVAVAVELGDAGDAIDRASRVDAAELSQERRGRFLIDIARAQAQRRNTPAAVAALLESEYLTPEQTRSHVLVRELVSDLLRSESGRANADLRSLARRLGLDPGYPHKKY
jgi:transcriptional regulator with XRE-family HTH domain